MKVKIEVHGNKKTDIPDEIYERLLRVVIKSSLKGVNSQQGTSLEATSKSKYYSRIRR